MAQEVAANVAQYSCKIGNEEFEVLTFNAHEELSRLFRFTLTLWSDNPEVDIQGLLRKTAKIKLEWGETAPKEKTWFGVVASISQTNAGKPGEVEKEYGHYACEVVPTFWLLGQKSQCRIFQDMSVKDILQKVLDERGMAGKYQLKLSKGYPPREYCLQYRETDLAFLSRLMEEEGIFYWFKHKGEEKMVIGDSPDAYGLCWPEEGVEYTKGTGVLAPGDEYLSELTWEESTYTGKVKYKDFNYRDPDTPLKAEQTAQDFHDLEIYDYHLERFRDDDRGKALAKVAVTAQSALKKTLSGAGTWRSITCGSIFKLEKAYRGNLNGKWTVVSASHGASQEAGGGVQYAVSFTAIPADAEFCPLPRTPQPVLNLQTATVVGPEGSEVYMDKWGRAKVQFHWDLEGEYNESSSCWIRVAQPYAGIDDETQKKHGFHWHPLVGDEVVVDFLEGDPDNPLIVGSVYNYVRNCPLKPEDLICNLLQTRYQHKLRFDDKNKSITLTTPYPHKLHLDDPAHKATLSTKYGHQLEMWDPHKDNSNVPDIELKTGGSEVLRMEDKQPDYGNNVKLSTADGHSLHMAEGPKAQGITAVTKASNTAVLDDKKKNILLRTTSGHVVLMDDANETIVVTSRKQHRIEISDKKDFIEISDSDGKHRFHIDIAGEKLTLETKTGDIDVLAPRGTVKIDAKAVDVKAQTSVKVDCNNMSTKATTDVKTQATKIEDKARAEIKMEAMNITSKAQMTNTRKGMMVNSEAGGIHKIRGMLVKIN